HIEFVRHAQRNIEILGHETQCETRIELTVQHVLFEFFLRAVVHAGRDVQYIDHGGGVDAELRADEQCLDADEEAGRRHQVVERDRKSTRLNSSHVKISYAVFCLKKKK